MLTLYKAYADLKAESQRTYIGYLWWIIDPIASMLVYYLVFEVVFDRGIENFSIFLFIGLIPWRWFQTSILGGANSIFHSRGVMLQVYLPKAIFPLVTFLSNTTKFLIVFFLMVIALIVAGFPCGWSLISLPMVLLVQGIFITGCTLIASAVTPFFPDLRMVLENLIRLWFFLSGIFYPISQLSPGLQRIFRLNPLGTLIESYRDILMFGLWPNFLYLVAIAAVGFVLNITGFAILKKYDYVYPRLSP